MCLHRKCFSAWIIPSCQKILLSLYLWGFGVFLKTILDKSIPNKKNTKINFYHINLTSILHMASHNPENCKRLTHRWWDLLLYYKEQRCRKLKTNTFFSGLNIKQVAFCVPSLKFIWYFCLNHFDIFIFYFDLWFCLHKCLVKLSTLIGWSFRLQFHPAVPCIFANNSMNIHRN